MTGNPDGARAAPRAEKLPYIDLLRGLSALYIVGFWHLMNYTAQFRGYANELTHRTTVVVLGLFVFLSGHLLAQSRLAPGLAGLKRFLTRRLLRIYPLYLAALILLGLPATLIASWLIQKAYDLSLETFSFGEGDRNRLSKR